VELTFSKIKPELMVKNEFINYEPLGLALTRTLGDGFLKQIGTGVISEPYVSAPIPLKDTDSFFVLASDGVST
jgi:serine/threonine protein phosphatase PrpC